MATANNVLDLLVLRYGDMTSAEALEEAIYYDTLIGNPADWNKLGPAFVKFTRMRTDLLVYAELLEKEENSKS